MSSKSKVKKGGAKTRGQKTRKPSRKRKAALSDAVLLELVTMWQMPVSVIAKNRLVPERDVKQKLLALVRRKKVDATLAKRLMTKV